VHVEVLEPVRLPVPVVARDHPHQHRGIERRHTVQRQTRVLERLPGDLRQQPLLRVHAFGLTRRDPEELRVEFLDTVQKAAIAAHHPAWGAGAES
jgi:hypothetical protein